MKQLVVKVGVKKGDVLLTAKPFSYVLKSKLRGKRCEYCFTRSEDLNRCSACHVAFYCNRRCQIEAWPDHRGECQGLKKVAPKIVPDTARLMARIINKLQKGGDKEEGKITETRSRKFKDLMSHYSDIKQDLKRMEHFESLCGVLGEYIGVDKLPNEAELLGIYGRICINSFNILDEEMLSIGTGIYLGPTIIDHSCEPTAVAVFSGTTLVIRATQDIPAFNWSKVFISYIDLLSPAAERRSELLKRYYFTCECPRCTHQDIDSTMECVMCTNESCKKPVCIKSQDLEYGISINRCTECGQQFKDTTAQDYIELAALTKEHLTRMSDVTYLDVCKVVLRRQEPLFHPLNLLRARMLDSAFDSAIEMNQWEDALSIGLELLIPFRRYYGVAHPLYGIQLLKMGKLHFYLGHSKEALTMLQEAMRVIKITHGGDHKLMREQLEPLLMQSVSENTERK